MKQKSTLHLTGCKVLLIFIFIQGALTNKVNKTRFPGSHMLSFAEGLRGLTFHEPLVEMDLSGSVAGDDTAVKKPFISRDERLKQLFARESQDDSKNSQDD